MKKILLLLSTLVLMFTLTECKKSIRTDIIIKDTDQNSSNIEPDKTIPGNNIDETDIKALSNHTGLFNVQMSGYKGELFIGMADDKLYGTIKFFNWGNGVPQPIIDLRVTDDKIYFRRVIKTKEDLIKYGGTAYFEQDFYGIFTTDKKTIKGYYRYIGTQDNWEAIKK